MSNRSALYITRRGRNRFRFDSNGSGANGRLRPYGHDLQCFVTVRMSCLTGNSSDCCTTSSSMQPLMACENVLWDEATSAVGEIPAIIERTHERIRCSESVAGLVSQFGKRPSASKKREVAGKDSGEGAHSGEHFECRAVQCGRNRVEWKRRGPARTSSDGLSK